MTKPDNLLAMIEKTTRTPTASAPLAAARTAETRNVVRAAPTLETAAREAERRVMDLAKSAAAAPPGALAEKAHGTLETAYRDWRSQIRALVAKGEFESPAVKSFSKAVQQAALMHENLPDEALGLEGSHYADLVRETATTLFFSGAGSERDARLAENPLLSVPPVSEGFRAGRTAATPMTALEHAGNAYNVRSDVAVIYCPGVARLGGEFDEHIRNSFKSGVAAFRAETGSFHAPEANAEQIAAAIAEAKKALGNPDAKVILVGYSQGVTNALAMMCDEKNQFVDARSSVIGIQTMHGAHGGSALADLAMAIGTKLSGGTPSPAEEKLLRAYYEAKAETLGLPPLAAKVNAHANDHVGTAVGFLRRVWGPVAQALGNVLRWFGFKGIPEEQWRLDLARFITMEAQLDFLKENFGVRGQALADKLGPFAEQFAFAYNRAVLMHPELSGITGAYLRGGLQSLTTEYCDKLLQNPKLRENLQSVLLLNGTGAVPEERWKDLVPPSQRLNYRFFRALGVPSDFQVSLASQQLEKRLPTAVDLPPQSIGHWGVAGVEVPRDHPASFFKDFNPQGFARASMTTFAELGML